ncbi:MAG: autotransporter-associated beta strand repeat-containing protein [Alphaproteobacteria bacterium]|nr:autotransporter-associated beta strand repeat-containing protein [Alphaproteobacteria bacterium]MBV9900136.1 autotransporter-associated beta strand repeat-containing protein [Alphaproteobacteria bacterium]
MLMLGTALGGSLGISSAAGAQNIAYNGPGPYALTQTTPVSGGPRAIDVTVTSGDATVDTSATTVTSTNNGSTAGVGIGVNNTGPGNVAVKSGDVTANGTGQNTGIDVRANAGTITIGNLGTVNASGNNADRAIVARSGGGDVVITSNVANGQQYGIIVTGNGGTFGSTGTSTITSTSATANGTGLVNAIVGQGYGVVINSGTASNTNAGGVQGTAIFANASAGGVLINAGTTSALGQNQAALQVFSEGAVDVTSGAIRTTQNSDGLSIQSGTNVVVRSTSVVTEGAGGARGIVLGGNGGGGGFNGGPNGFAYNSATVTSGSIATAGNSSHGIYATPNGPGSTTINSGAITTAGPNANGIFITQIGSGAIGGPVTVNSTGLLQTSGSNSSGIRYNGGTGAVTINNSGTISTGGASGLGILVFNSNGATITSNAIATTGGGVSTGIQVGSSSQATNPLVINSGTINVANSASSGSGILATASSGGATTITSGTVNIAGSGSGIGITNPAGATGDITITSGDINLGAPPSATFRQAIGTFATAGTTTINSTGTIQSGGYGILLQARTGETGGNVDITSNVINAANSAISVAAGSAVSIKAASTTTSGDGQAAIFVTPNTGGAVTIQAGTLTTTGANALGINVSTNVAGTTAIDVGTANTIASAVDARTRGDLTVTSGTAHVTGAGATGLTAISSGGTSAVKSTDLTTVNRGIYAKGLDSATVISGNLVATNADRAIIATTSAASNGDSVIGTGAGVVSVTTGSLTTNGIGINAYGPRATVNVDSGTLLTTGNVDGIAAFGLNVNVTSGTLTSGGNGINFGYETGSTERGVMVVNSGAVNLNGVAGTTAGGITGGGGSTVTVNSGTITASGAGNRFGIAAQTAVSATAGDPNRGALTVNSGSISAIGDGGYGIFGLSDAGAVKIASTGQITTVGTTRMAGNQPRYSAGIIAVSSSGSIDVTSNNIATSGAQADGVRVEAGRAIASYNQAVTVAPAPISVTTTGLTQTGGANAAGINVLGGGGAVTIANTGTIMTAGDTAYGVSVSAAEGVTDVKSSKVTTAGANATGIRLAGTGAIGATSGIVSTANANGIDVRTSGAVTIASGTVTAGGAASTGIIGLSSGGGAVTINADSTTGGRRGIFTAFSGGVTTINSNFATASGLSQPNAIIGQGATVTVNSKTATLTGNGNQGAAIFVQSGAGGATINSGLASTEGLGQVGIQLYSDTNGAIDSGTVTTLGDFARGIYSNATGPNVVKSGSVTTSGDSATGIYVSPSPAAADQPASGSVTVVSASVATTGNGAVGILVSPITPTGTGNASVLTGATSITSGTIATAGSGSTGISVGGTTGAVTIASNGIATQGASAAGIRAQSTVGAVSIQSGNVTTQGAGAQGIFAQTTDGAIAINAGTTTTAATGQDPATNGTSDAVFGLATGAGSVTIVSQNASTNGDYANAVGAVGGGAVNITSGTASTSGIQVASVYGNSRNADTNITAVNTTATGQNAYAVEGHAAHGNVTITSGTASAAHGDAIFASAGGKVDIGATVANAAGDGGAGVAASGGTGVTLNIGSASSTGTATANGTAVFRADAIYAEAVNGAITANVGSAKALGAGADGIRLIANGTGGAVTLEVTGTVSSAGGNGIFIDPPGAVVVSVGGGASVTGATAGLNTTGASNSIVNAGSISSSGGPAILASGATSLNNSGTLAGANGVAVQLGASDDTVLLQTGSSVSGTISGGGGTDRAYLAGTGAAASAGQTVATFDGFSSLNVASGYWTASSAPSSFGGVSVAQGSTLELRSVAGQSGLSIAAPTIADAGTLVVRTAAGATSSFGNTQLTGSGLFNVTGAGTLTVATDNSGFTGNTRVDGGTLQLTGTLGRVETAAGGTFILGNGGTSGNVTGDVIDNGTFVANRSDNYTLAGGLSGNGTFIKQGAGSFTFGGTYTFTGSVNVAGGSVRFSKGLAANSEIDLSGGGKLDLSGQANSVAELAGSSPTATIDIAGGTLTVNQATNTTFAGSLTGAGGAFNKTGAGTLNLTGASTYTGPTSVTGGTLAVNGSLTSIVGVNNGGKLGGNGTVGGINAGNGGTVGPGNSIGTLNVAGNVAFGPGSTYQVEANAAGQADKIVATGAATLTGGTVAVLAQPGTYARITGYTILTANGGVTGTFSNVTSNLAFLSPLLTYSANAVQLTLGRNDVAFSAFAADPNQVRTANAIQALGLGNGLYNLVLGQTDAGTRTALASLASEVHAGVGTAILDQERGVREAMLDRTRSNAEGTGLWLRGLADWAHSRGGSSLRLGVDRKGVLGGIDGALGGLRVGAIGGYVEGDLDVRSQSASAKDRTKLVGVYAGWNSGALSVRGGADWSWHDIDTNRSIAFPGVAGTASASYKAQSGQFFGEIAYNLLTGPVSLEPFADYAHVRSRSDGFAETGTAGALNVRRDRRDANFATLGLRLSGAVPVAPGTTLRPRVSAAWQRGWGDLAGTTAASFAPNGGTFVLTGAGVGRDTLVLDGGFDAELGGGLSVGASANASVSSRWSSTGLRATLGLRF